MGCGRYCANVAGCCGHCSKWRCPPRARGASPFHRQLQDARGSRTDGQRVVAKLKQRWAQSMGGCARRELTSSLVLAAQGCARAWLYGRAGRRGDGWRGRCGHGLLGRGCDDQKADGCQLGQRQAADPVLGDGVMSEAPGAGFAGAAPLSIQAESTALEAIATREEVAPIAFQANLPITLVRFDALLVDQLGLGDVAEHVQLVAVAAGLTPPGYFGSEVVARYLGLRYKHPAGEEAWSCTHGTRSRGPKRRTRSQSRWD